MKSESDAPCCLNCGLPSKLHIVGFCMPGLRLTPKERAAQRKKNAKLQSVGKTGRTIKTKRKSLRGGGRGEE